MSFTSSALFVDPVSFSKRGEHDNADTFCDIVPLKPKHVLLDKSSALAASKPGMSPAARRGCHSVASCAIFPLCPYRSSLASDVLDFDIQSRW